MTEVCGKANLSTLDSLRIVRRKLYSIPESELAALSLEDQEKFGNSLHRTSLAILELEAAKLKGVNDAFKGREEELKEAAEQLEQETVEMTNVVSVIRFVSKPLELIIDIIGLIK